MIIFPPRIMPIIIVIEGNTCSGKSTIINLIKELRLKDTAVLPDRINAWTDYRGYNSLQLLNSDPKRFTFAFNVVTLLTQVEAFKTVSSATNFVIQEGYLGTSQYIIHPGQENNVASGIDFEKAVFTHLENRLPEHRVHFIIYLRTDPTICFNRAQKTYKDSPQQPSLHNMIATHSLYEKWLGDKTLYKGANVIILNGNEDAMCVASRINTYLNQYLYYRNM